MTDSIDLDGIETESEDEPRPNRGDWFWRGDGDFEGESEALADSDPPDPSAGARNAGSEAKADSGSTTPHVPHENRNKPVGMPEGQGGAGGTSAREAAKREDRSGGVPDGASGPHGGGADEMTVAITYEAAKRLTDPAFAFANATTFADWIGIVGEVDAHVINNFQRTHGVDADFFNGTGTGPSERLAGVTELSMFFAERMVVLGCEDEKWIAEEAGWEFVPIDTAAEKAGWELD